MGLHDHNPQNYGELSYDNLPYVPDLDYRTQELLVINGQGYCDKYHSIAETLEGKGWKVRDLEFSPTCERITELWYYAAWNYLGRRPNGSEHWPLGYKRPSGTIFQEDFQALMSYVQDLDQRGRMPEERGGPFVAEGEDGWVTFGDLRWMALANLTRTMYCIKLVILCEKMVWKGSHGGRPPKPRP